MSAKGYALHRPHPWHGLDPGPGAPELVAAYIEITPFDVIKYEVDKASGYLCVDRPQGGAASPPCLYGFIPRSFCDERVAALCDGAGRGDGDPLDICVISERPIQRADIIVHARVVGGLTMIDNDEADDKIIAVLHNDPVWGTASEVAHLPQALISRLMHYFSIYKYRVGSADHPVAIEAYDRAHALAVIEAAFADYQEEFVDGSEAV
jgi:inorganic pyrophosphatase